MSSGGVSWNDAVVIQRQGTKVPRRKENERVGRQTVRHCLVGGAWLLSSRKFRCLRFAPLRLCLENLLHGFAKDDDPFRKAMRLGAEWRMKANQEGR